MITREAVDLGSAMLDEARAYLRLETEEEDASLGTVLLGAIGHAEAWLGQMLLRRDVTEILPVSNAWQRLGTGPVRAVFAANGLPAEGAAFAMPLGSYKTEIDANGDGWLRVPLPGSAGRIEIVYEAGLAANWEQLPEGVRLGVLRLAAHLHSNRDDSADAGPPEGVAALLRPWRRVRL